jgi:thiamine pyrophosphate-dependent acetolactate synthase large subunit-like protein
MYTISSVFLRTLSTAGITHAFVNWGSDHPALLEDLERQRTENHDSTTRGDTTNPTIITCPNEMVALSAAQGYAQVTGNPAAVIVHVDVGTQVSFSRVDESERRLRCLS